MMWVAAGGSALARLEASFESLKSKAPRTPFRLTAPLPTRAFRPQPAPFLAVCSRRRRPGRSRAAPFGVGFASFSRACAGSSTTAPTLQSRAKGWAGRPKGEPVAGVRHARVVHVALVEGRAGRSIAMARQPGSRSSPARTWNARHVGAWGGGDAGGLAGRGVDGNQLALRAAYVRSLPRQVQPSVPPALSSWGAVGRNTAAAR